MITFRKLHKSQFFFLFFSFLTQVIFYTISGEVQVISYTFSGEGKVIFYTFSGEGQVKEGNMEKFKLQRLAAREGWKRFKSKLVVWLVFGWSEVW